MSDINQSIRKTLVHEGGYVNNPHDTGGATKYGITQKDMPGVDMHTITEDQAIAYYKEHYVKDGYTQINDQNVLDKLFDMGVLFGVKEAVILLQRVLHILEDGVFGPMSLNAINSDGPSLLQDYKTELVSHVMKVLAAHPGDKVFAHGWINRVNS